MTQFKAARSKQPHHSLFLQNTSTSDVGVADLNLTIKAGQTINVYQSNPQLTLERVAESMKSGQLKHWIMETKMLRVVNKIVSDRPMMLDQIRVSDKPMMIKQTKSSIIIHPESVLDEEQKEGFDFADYGVDEAAIKPAPMRNPNGVITVGDVEAVIPVRSIKAIAAGKDAVENLNNADRVIDIDTKVLGENGESVELKVVEEENAIVMKVGGDAVVKKEGK